MEPPVTPKPMLASSPDLPTDHTIKFLGIVYITLTGVIDTIIPAAGLWSWVGKFMYYLIKLALILWWALPAKPATCVFSKKRAGTQGWIPDRFVFTQFWKGWYQATEGLAPTEVQVHGRDTCLVIGKVLEEFAVMQAKYKLQPSHMPQLVNHNPSQVVPGFDPVCNIIRHIII
ncbi:hypothetical protein DSO57_1025538 [Entomophthora muscae]|uniref:Uncharacterized protein n=1 Tax=Entomophthora muscae TaxID=34485 RepID=A0ACC2UC29_9FUNG|nr:hypothetical protein DSO57_1025538 [Entomophthora muscae]